MKKLAIPVTNTIFSFNLYVISLDGHSFQTKYEYTPVKLMIMQRKNSSADHLSLLMTNNDIDISTDRGTVE
jgi:hypothetical protein